MKKAQKKHMLKSETVQEFMNATQIHDEAMMVRLLKIGYETTRLVEKIQRLEKSL